MAIREIRLEELDPQAFIEQKVREIFAMVGEGSAINTLSGGVDSSAATMLGHLALGNRLKTVFIDNGIMRQGEPEQVYSTFRSLGIPIELIGEQARFYNALRGKIEPNDKRKAISVTFCEVFGVLVRQSRARFVLQGTNYADVKISRSGLQPQHNVFSQLGIDTEAEYHFKVIEPLVQLKKPAVRLVAKTLGLPEAIYNRQPFPGPALAIRVMGEATPEEIELLRRATAIVEEMLEPLKPAQCSAILHTDRTLGLKDGQRRFDRIIEVTCFQTDDFITAIPTEIPYTLQIALAERITREIPQVVKVVQNITPKPPATMEPG